MSGTWKLIDYYDVWHNEEDGYWVNDVSTLEEGITITDDASEEDIFKYLKETLGYTRLTDVSYEEAAFYSDDSFIEIFKVIGEEVYPLCRLERER